jgi:hypothetical protein
VSFKLLRFVHEFRTSVVKMLCYASETLLFLIEMAHFVKNSNRKLYPKFIQTTRNTIIGCVLSELVHLKLLLDHILVAVLVLNCC